MESDALTDLLLWFANTFSGYPVVIFSLTAIGTIVVIISILAPIIVKLTYWTDKDDKLWAFISSNDVFVVLVNVLSRFSVYIPKKKKGNVDGSVDK